ncbi:MAG: insulinase family protein [Bacteroidaceae bacterium]
MRKLLLLLIIISIYAVTIHAQTYVYAPKSEIPVDNKTIKGRLTNGFTYYIRHNTIPEKKVELRLVINAGSILETDKQQGLGHFLEHMSFNGTKSFPNAEMIKTLEGMGVRFGHELNAYTSFDETVYYLPIASDKIEVGLTALEDWAMNLTLAEKEIDRERGVVLEELRLGKGASTRIREQYLPVLFAGSRYPIRLPIGKEEVIANFTYDELRSYYKEWHRPDLMAVMVIGDINPLEVEKEIIKKFGVYEMPKDAKPRFANPVPNHKQTKVVIATDSETSGCSVEVSYKHTPRCTLTQKDYLENTIYHSLYSSMINARLAELINADEPPFTEAESGYSNYFREVDTYSSYARCAPEGVLKALGSLAVENERVKRYGFTLNELERAKIKMLAGYERWYNEREKTSSDRYADEFQVNYLKGEPIPGIEYEYVMIKDLLPRVGLKKINGLAKKYMTKDNRVVVVTGPNGKNISYPKESEFISILDGVAKQHITPYDEGEIVTSLMNTIPKAGTIVSEKYFPETNITEWKLSNGTTVVMKPTNFRNNQVLFRATSNGGFGMYPADDDMSGLYASRIQDESGVNGINNTQLRRLMTGKDISLTQSLVLSHESMSGKYGLKDMETFFQLVYLYHTAPYFDEGAFERLMKQERTEYAKLLDSPTNYFGYQIDKIMSNGNPRRNRWPIKENLDKVDFTKAKAIYKSRFGNAAGFTYVLVGNINIEEVKPYILTYLGGLPADSTIKQGLVEQHFTTPTSPASFVFNKGTDVKANVSLKFVKPCTWTKEKEKSYAAFIDVLNSRLFESLRRDMSGVYGVRVTGTIDRGEDKNATLSISFGTNVESYEALYDRTIVELKRLITEGPTTEELARVKEKQRVALIGKIKENSTWLLDIFYSYRYGDKVDTEQEREQAIEILSVQNIQSVGKECIDVDKHIKFILLPKEKE